MAKADPFGFDLSVSSAKKKNPRGRKSMSGAVETSQRGCDHEGCTETGQYRAPKARDVTDEYYWFCKDHVRELHLTDRVRCKFILLDHDEKRFHTYQELWHEDGWLAATGEALGLHIDTSGPRVAPFPPDIKANLEAMQAAHDTLPRPERAGRKIGLRRK